MPRDDTDRKEDQNRMSQYAGGTEHRENIVAQCGQFDLLLQMRASQKDTKRKEQEINRCEGKAIGVHILLCVFQALAGKVFCIMS